MSALGDAGFDFALRGIGERFGYDNMTCFHASYMGITHVSQHLSMCLKVTKLKGSTIALN